MDSAKSHDIDKSNWLGAIWLYVFIYVIIILLVHVLGVIDSIGKPFKLAALNSEREASIIALIIEMLSESATLAFQFAGYVLIVVVLNFIPLIALIAGLRILESRLRSVGVSILSGFLLAVICFWVAAIAFNKLFFPRSSFALLLSTDDTFTLWVIGVGAFAIYSALSITPIIWLFSKTLIRFRKATVLVAASLVMPAIGSIQSLSHQESRAAQNIPSTLPNIIIIGLDSVSPRHLERHPGALSTLEGLLRESATFENALTPLGRTFPAWTSILTSKYPVHSGARFNLTDFGSVEIETTLPRILQRMGYTTIYAQDERKFNNIDESFGFKYTVGPRPGAAEFVLTKIADHPLANLALLAPWSDLLFPFIAINRASDIHYDPDQFVGAVKKHIFSDNDKPLFLATHFCLAHYPYTWRTQNRRMETGESLTLEQRHFRALEVVERQISDILEALRKAGRLDNAILVILSDHGESLGYPDGRWISVENYINTKDIFEIDGFTAFPTTVGFTGHGSDILDRTQHEVILAFRGFGKMAEAFDVGAHTRLASLVDVMPTIFAALGWMVPEGLDGIDLMLERDELGYRTIPVETGIRFAALTSIIAIDEGALLRESSDYYTIDPKSARLTIKSERYSEIVASKDIAIHSDEWMLALLRKDLNFSFPRVALLVEKSTGAWTIGNDTELIERAPLEVLTEAARFFYGNEIDDFAQTWAFTVK